MKKIWLVIISLFASINHAQADVCDVVMSFDEDAINVDASDYNEDEVMRFEQLLCEYEFLSAEEQIEASKEINKLAKILTDKGVLMRATFVCAVCQGGK